MPPKEKVDTLRADLLLWKSEIIDCFTKTIQSEIGVLVKKEIDLAITSLRCDLVARFEDVDSQIKRVEEKIDSNSANIVTTVVKLSTKLNKSIQNAEKNKRTCADLPPKSSPKINSLNLSDALNEIKERELKKDNVIIFNLEEKDDDKTSFNSICEVLEVDVQPEKLFRIGSTTSGKCRPLIVKTNSVASKSVLLRNAHKLRNLPDVDPRKKAVLKQDLTRKEQDAQRALFNELKTRRSLGESIVIRNGKIVSKSPTTDDHRGGD